MEYTITVKKECIEGEEVWVAKSSQHEFLENYADTQEEAEYLLLDGLMISRLIQNPELERGTWTPIDYSLADSGKGCFDGKPVFVKSDNLIVSAVWVKNGWRSPNDEMLVMRRIDTTHYRPIPADWIGDVK